MERNKFIKTFIFGAGFLVFNPFESLAEIEKLKGKKVRMIYNNTGSAEFLKKEWGLSVWIESENDALLFDTGGDASVLISNMSKLDIDLSKLKTIVISHNHWDHTNGLKAILEETNYTPLVYVPSLELQDFTTKLPKATCTGILDPLKITDGIWSTGQLSAVFSGLMINEQSLILMQGSEMVLLTGCSHPGIVEIATRAKEVHPDKKLILIAGGFHLNRHTEDQVKKISLKLKDLNVERIAPSHCTGELAIQVFRSEWDDRFVDFNLGDNLNV